MTSRPEFQRKVTLLQQRINAELDVIETRFSDDIEQLAKFLKTADGSGDDQRAAIYRAGAERANAFVLEHATAVVRIPGITIHQAEAALQQFIDRARQGCGPRKV